jgi:hypothetical protein
MKTWAFASLAIMIGLLALALACGSRSSSRGSAAPDDEPAADDDNDSSPAADDDSAGGVWTDSASGLTWQMTPPTGNYNWGGAQTYCNALNLAGRSGWRLPTISELRSLVRGCPGTQTGDGCGVTDQCLDYDSCWTKACGGCDDGAGPGGGCYWPSPLGGSCEWYWSASAVAGSEAAWIVLFEDAYVDDNNVYFDNQVRCVHS